MSETETVAPIKNKGGRPKGSRNKATEFIKPIAQRYGPDCLEAMVKLIKNPKVKPADKKACAELVLAYGYGKPVQAHELSGKGGGPILSANVAGIDESLAGIVNDLEKQEPVN